MKHLQTFLMAWSLRCQTDFMVTKSLWPSTCSTRTAIRGQSGRAFALHEGDLLPFRPSNYCIKKMKGAQYDAIQIETTDSLSFLIALSNQTCNWLHFTVIHKHFQNKITAYPKRLLLIKKREGKSHFLYLTTSIKGSECHGKL